MIEVLKALSVFFAYAVMAVFAQNAVFTRALGVSRLVKLVDDTTVDSLTRCCVLSSSSAHRLDTLSTSGWLSIHTACISARW